MEVGSSSLPGTTLGGLAQLARAPALQAGGQRFESVILHNFVMKRMDEVNPVPDTVGVLRRKSFFDMLRQRRHKIRISVTLRFHSLPLRALWVALWRGVLGSRCLLSYARREKGRTADALAHGGDEGRDKLR